MVPLKTPKTREATKNLGNPTPYIELGRSGESSGSPVEIPATLYKPLYAM